VSPFPSCFSGSYSYVRPLARVAQKRSDPTSAFSIRCALFLAQRDDGSHFSSQESRATLLESVRSALFDPARRSFSEPAPRGGKQRRRWKSRLLRVSIGFVDSRRKSFRIRFYVQRARNPFRIRFYAKHPGCVPFLSPVLGFGAGQAGFCPYVILGLHLLRQRKRATQ
jgi:hypothetical protein